MHGENEDATREMLLNYNECISNFTRPRTTQNQEITVSFSSSFCSIDQSQSVQGSVWFDPWQPLAPLTSLDTLSSIAKKSLTMTKIRSGLASSLPTSPW